MFQPPPHLRLLYFSTLHLVAVHLMAPIYQAGIESSAGLCVKKIIIVPHLGSCVIHEINVETAGNEQMLIDVAAVDPHLNYVALFYTCFMSDDALKKTN